MGLKFISAMFFLLQLELFWKSFFGGKRHFIYGPKSIWSKQIRGYKFSPHSRKVYNLQRKVELSFIEAGLVSKFLWPFFGFFKAFSSTYRILLKSNRIACKKKLFMQQTIQKQTGKYVFQGKNVSTTHLQFSRHVGCYTVKIYR